MLEAMEADMEAKTLPREEYADLRTLSKVTQVLMDGLHADIKALGEADKPKLISGAQALKLLKGIR
jgi:hypothetical protein